MEEKHSITEEITHGKNLVIITKAGQGYQYLPCFLSHEEGATKTDIEKVGQSGQTYKSLICYWFCKQGYFPCPTNTTC